MRSIRITVPGTPVGRAGNAEDAKYRRRIHAAFFDYMMEHHLTPGREMPLCEPVQIDVIAYFAVPKFTTKRKRRLMLSGDIPYTRKPDADDIARNVLAALNSCAFKSRCQVTSIYGTKLYAEEAHTEILIIVGQGI